MDVSWSISENWTGISVVRLNMGLKFSVGNGNHVCSVSLHMHSLCVIAHFGRRWATFRMPYLPPHSKNSLVRESLYESHTMSFLRVWSIRWLRREILLSRYFKASAAGQDSSSRRIPSIWWHSARNVIIDKRDCCTFTISYNVRNFGFRRNKKDVCNSLVYTLNASVLPHPWGWTTRTPRGLPRWSRPVRRIPSQTTSAERWKCRACSPVRVHNLLLFHDTLFASAPSGRAYRWIQHTPLPSHQWLRHTAMQRWCGRGICTIPLLHSPLHHAQWCGYMSVRSFRWDCDHELHGNWSGFCEYHIQMDWLLVPRWEQHPNLDTGRNWNSCRHIRWISCFYRNWLNLLLGALPCSTTVYLDSQICHVVS